MDSEKLAELAAEACDDRKAKNINMIHIRKVSSLADWIVIAEGIQTILRREGFPKPYEA